MRKASSAGSNINSVKVFNSQTQYLTELEINAKSFQILSHSAVVSETPKSISHWERVWMFEFEKD